MGHSITLLTPLVVQEVLDENNQPMGWAVEGRPADCVKLALMELLPEPPDLIVSGLNAGSNSGINVLYSGTVAAAIEGAFYGHTAIAVSLEYTKPKPLDFPRAAKMARSVIEQILRQPGAPGTLLNINIPSLEKGPIQENPYGAAERVGVPRELRPPYRSSWPGLLLEQARLPLFQPRPRYRRQRPG